MNKPFLSLIGSLFLLNSAYSQDPGLNINAADTIRKGIEYNDEGDYEQAITMFNKVHPGDTNYTWALYEKSLSLTEAEMYPEAISTARQGIRLTDSASSLYFNIIGTALDHSDQQQEALAVYEAGIQRFPVDHKLFYNRSVVYDNLEEHAKTLADLKKAIEYNPFHASSHLGLAKMALQEEQFAQALLSLGYYLMLEPRGDRTNATLVQFNNALMGDGELTSKNLTLSKPADDFKKLNLLLSNKVALQDDYEIESDIDLPIIRQLHLAISQASKKKKLTGFWENYYLPFYRQLQDEELFEPFSYYVLLSSGSERHQKIIEKNSSDISEFIDWAGGQIKSVHGLHPENYVNDGEEIRFWFSDESNDIRAIGQVNKEDQPVGDYTYYYTSGRPSSQGSFNNKAQQDGTWQYYHTNGVVSIIRPYKNGEKQGVSKEYFDNGYHKISLPYTDDEVQGLVKVYDEKGYLHRLMYYQDQLIEDSLVYHYPHGPVERFLPMKKDQIEGQALYYHPNGELSYEVPYKEDQRHGPFKDYFASGKTASEGSYQEGEYQGPYKSFYPSGQVQSEGAYEEGAKKGDWKYYYFNGKLKSKASYDEKGKENGVQESYNQQGLLTDRFVYVKGEIKEYYHFNRQGEIIHEDKRRFGKFWYEGYSVDGVKTMEGNYEGDHKEGPWKYYTDNGNLYKEENYNDEGDLHGNYITYHNDGTPSRKTSLQEGELEGYDVYFHSDGSIELQGYSIAGERNGIWETYFKDSTISIQNFYVNGELNGPQYYFDVAGELYMIKEFDKGLLTKVHTTRPDSSLLHTHQVKQRDGSEVYYLTHGQKRYELPLKGGAYNGTATWWHGHGQVDSRGKFLNGERQGKWQWFHPDGSIKTEGQYVQGTRTGEWVNYYRNGDKSLVYHYANGELHGKYESFWENGKTEYSSNYNQGEREGRYTFYDEEGQVNHIRYYETGRIIGYSYLNEAGEEVEMIALPQETGTAKSYYPNGQLAREYTLKHGSFEGPYRTYHQNGQVAYKANYVHDLREGMAYDYYADGTKKTAIDYHLNDYHGSYTKYWPSGQVKFKGHYLNDEKHGLFERYDEDGELISKYQYRNGMLIKEL